jgi:hypothetical protein
MQKVATGVAALEGLLQMFLNIHNFICFSGSVFQRLR